MGREVMEGLRLYAQKSHWCTPPRQGATKYAQDKRNPSFTSLPVQLFIGKCPKKPNFVMFCLTLTAGVVVVAAAAAAVAVGDVTAAAAVVQPHLEDGLQDGADAGVGHFGGAGN